LDVFFERLPTARGAIFGLEYFELEEPFRSKINLMSSENLTAETQVMFASYLSTAEQTDVVIPDLTANSEVSEGRYLLMRRDGTFSPALETVVADRSFDVIAESRTLPVSALLR
jgi:hypothetical protein